MRQSDRGRLFLYDKLIVGFSLLMVTIIILLGRPLTNFIGEIAFFLAAALIVPVMARYLDANTGRWQKFIRLLYPVVLFTFFYTAMGGLIFLLFDQFFDPQLTAFEKSILGYNPTLYIDKHLLNVWTNEFLSACYYSYYLMLPAFFITMFIKRRDAIIVRTMSAVCITFFVSYLLFILYPVEGPRWFFADIFQNEIEGPFFRQIVNYVIDNAAFHGGCMPSSHVAVAIVILLATFKYYRKAGYILLIPNIGLAIGTFWGRFHYVSDIFVGAAIGIAAWILIEKQPADALIDQYETKRPKEKSKSHAS